MVDAARRIGRLVWPCLRASKGMAAVDALQPLIERFGIGGVIVFGEGQPDVARLIAALRLRVGGRVLVSSDLERGCGQQLREYTHVPAAMALAAHVDPEVIHRAGVLTAVEARAAGIDVVYAPVADVNTATRNPIIATRAFGDDPHRVAELASRFAAGLHEGGVLAVAKHFPGHGSTVQDSHLELARITRSEEELEAIDLVPFRTLIAEGVAGLMVGHLEVPAMDPVPGRPATASPNVVLDHLRRRLGFGGLVVTDALDMGGFRQDPLAPLDALHAGHDVLLMPADPLATCESLLAAHERHELSDEVLDGAVARVDAAVARLDSLTAPSDPPAPAEAEEWLAESLTSNGQPMPTFEPGEAIDVTVFGSDSGGMIVPPFLEAFEAHGHPVEAGGRRVALVLTAPEAWANSARLDDKQRKRLHWNVERGRFEAVVVLGSPYEMLELPAGAPAVLAYEGSPRVGKLAARVVLGLRDAPGRLPVGVPT